MAASLLGRQLVSNGALVSAMLMQLQVLHKLLLGDLGLMPHTSLVAVGFF